MISDRERELEDLIRDVNHELLICEGVGLLHYLGSSRRTPLLQEVLTRKLDGDGDGR